MANPDTYHNPSSIEDDSLIAKGWNGENSTTRAYMDAVYELGKSGSDVTPAAVLQYVADHSPKSLPPSQVLRDHYADRSIHYSPLIEREPS